MGRRRRRPRLRRIERKMRVAPRLRNLDMRSAPPAAQVRSAAEQRPQDGDAEAHHGARNLAYGPVDGLGHDPAGVGVKEAAVDGADADGRDDAGAVDERERRSVLVSQETSQVGVWYPGVPWFDSHESQAEDGGERDLLGLRQGQRLDQGERHGKDDYVGDDVDDAVG